MFKKKSKNYILKNILKNILTIGIFGIEYSEYSLANF